MGSDPRYRLVHIGAGGWDTHVNQGASHGLLSRRLSALDGALGWFFEPERSLPNVVLIVLTEFGRTTRENGSGGTDHGYGSVALILGDSVRGGQVLGGAMNLAEDSLHEGRDLPVTIDYRRIVLEVAERHLRVAREVLPDAQDRRFLGSLR